MKGQSRSSSTAIRRFKTHSKKSERWTCARVQRELKTLADPRVRAKMAYFGVRVPSAHGVSAPALHALAKEIGKDHLLAEQLWKTAVHEARILATLIGEPGSVTSQQMERWARDFDSWDVVDAACCYLCAHAKPAWAKAHAWTRRKEEYMKRAGFSLAAYLSYKDKNASDARFVEFLRAIEREAWDERNFVKKAVNWALRNIGKRNLALNRRAIACAERIRKSDSPVARWIAADAIRELRSKAVQGRLGRKGE
jgi:3-methyladenine DNA glycosylase AlkD